MFQPKNGIVLAFPPDTSHLLLCTAAGKHNATVSTTSSPNRRLHTDSTQRKLRAQGENLERTALQNKVTDQVPQLRIAAVLVYLILSSSYLYLVTELLPPATVGARKVTGLTHSDISCRCTVSFFELSRTFCDKQQQAARCCVSMAQARRQTFKLCSGCDWISTVPSCFKVAQLPLISQMHRAESGENVTQNMGRGG